MCHCVVVVPGDSVQHLPQPDHRGAGAGARTQRVLSHRPPGRQGHRQYR